ncbi:MAG: ShlB/FhaC/HecB family hemolysin secretion/activation protein, partial [Cyanobacteriota bacterium]
MLTLLAQLVAPPLQDGPVRLPGPAAGEQRLERRRPAPPLELKPGETPPASPGPSSAPSTSPPPSPPGKDLPQVRGFTGYGDRELAAIFQTCAGIAEPNERLKACAAILTARLVADGYLNTRVFTVTTPAPGYLEVVLGRIVEVRVSIQDPWLRRRVTRLLRPLQGSVLNLTELERQLRLLQRQGAVRNLRTSLSRLGRDPTQAVLTVNAELGTQPFQGEISLRNDGSSGTGDGRAVGTLVKGGIATPGDLLLLYGELNVADSFNPDLGAVISSISYTYPLADQFNLTGSFGYSRRNLVELAPPADRISTRQFQGLGQLEWVFKETLTQRWGAFAGLSLNRSDNYLSGSLFPAIQEVNVSPQIGYLRVGLSGSGLAPRVGWSGNVYALQGIGSLTPANQINELGQAGISPGQATALGGLVSAAWGFAPSWQINLRGGGQVALNPLLSSMQFTLGSDVGLRGLPGQLISGDSGWLGTGELVWTLWQKQAQALQLVPFFGYGGVSTRIQGLSFSDTVGSGGVLARWLAGERWTLEAGWV